MILLDLNLCGAFNVALACHATRGFQVKVEVRSDPSRLMKPTQASANRVAAEKENERTAKDSGNIRNVARKATTPLAD
jgi:hypothetical protein